jgi:hypothetical protein
MYHNCGVQKLSPAQIAKLKSGQAVRIKVGSHHTLPLRKDQIKKLQSAHKRGSGITIELDPTSLEHLHGSGFFDSMKKAFSHPITKQISQAVRPIATNMARSSLSAFGPTGQALGNATIDLLDSEAQKAGYGVKKKVGKKHYVHHDVRMYEPVEHGQHLHGSGFFDSLKKAASSNVAKSISKSLRPMATEFVRSNLPQDGVLGALSNLAVNEANALAERHGYGVAKRRRGRPRKGGALIAAGY